MRTQKHLHRQSIVARVPTEAEELLTEKNDHYGNNARVFTLTEKSSIDGLLSLFHTETWINAIEQDPDLHSKQSPSQNDSIAVPV
jgi:hypothetical protein